MARRVRLTEAQKVELRAFGSGDCSCFYRGYPPHIKLVDLGFISPSPDGVWGLTPEGRDYLNGAHK